MGQLLARIGKCVALWLVSVYCTLAPALCHAQTVAAASDLKFALDDIHAAFKAKTRQHIHLVFGSSGNLYRQIEQGAPFELFLSADESFVNVLVQSGKTMDAGRVYAKGHLAWVVSAQSMLVPDNALNQLKQAVQNKTIRKFAIANPAFAPYGMRAKETLQNLGLWQEIVPNLVLGDNVSQAAQFALSDSTDGGLVALSLLKSPAFQGKVRYAEVPAELHSPLIQRMVLLKGASSPVKAFYEFLSTPQAQSILNRYGFETVSQ